MLALRQEQCFIFIKNMQRYGSSAPEPISMRTCPAASKKAGAESEDYSSLRPSKKLAKAIFSAEVCTVCLQVCDLPGGKRRKETLAAQGFRS